MCQEGAADPAADGVNDFTVDYFVPAAEDDLETEALQTMTLTNLTTP